MAEIMSEEGFKAILAEIQYLESVERPKASQAIAEARDKGDLSENAEYDAAKDAQGKLEARIALLKDKVANARIIDATKLSTEKIQIMSKVRLLNHKLKKEVTYTIVSESEANFMEGKISVATPIAKALLNHKVGDIVEVRVPAGVQQLEVLDISLQTTLSFTIMTIFSRIVAGEIPSYKVAEDDQFYAFLDISPVAKGHTLVIPKQEVDYIFDESDEQLSAHIVFAKRVAAAIKKAIPCVKVGMCVMGLEVPHAHIHLIPMQTEGDMNFRKEHLKLDAEEMKAICEKIAANFE